MYMRMIRRDLKRKKAMNLILLLFVLLATTFVASGVNNIMTILPAIDEFNDMSNMTDYMIITLDSTGGTQSTKDTLERLECIEGYTADRVQFITNDDMSLEGESFSAEGPLLAAFQSSTMNYFDDNDEQITTLEPGHILVPGKLRDKNPQLNVGDKLTLSLDGRKTVLTVDAFIKDAVFGTPFMGSSRYLLAQEDFDRLCGSAPSDTGGSIGPGCIYMVSTDDIPALRSEIAKDGRYVFAGGRADTRFCYVMDMISAAILLIVSVCLMFIAFMVLRFTIGFTISEEFREIGVMKAIGLRAPSIRLLYLAKYAFLALLGAGLGYAASLPFGTLMLKLMSRHLVVKSASPLVINAVCAAAVVLFVLLFSYGCTKRINKLTPIDAVRDGSRGETYKAKSVVSLSRSRLRPVPFIALNDMLGNLRSMSSMICAFALGSVLLMILSVSVSTLNSPELVESLCMTRTHYYLSTHGSELYDFAAPDGREKILEQLEGMEKRLADEGMPADCCMEVGFRLKYSHGDTYITALTLQGCNTKAEDYTYLRGSAPQNAGEIALTRKNAEALGADIGDTVYYYDMGRPVKCIVTGIFQSMMNMGDSVRLHEDAKVDYSQIMTFLAYQVNFRDDPDAAELLRRRELLPDIFPDMEVYDAADYVDHMINVQGTVKVIRILLVPIMLLICILVATLLEHSFIEKETGEIAMLKAMGFRDSAVIGWHTLRMVFASLLAYLIAALLSYPLSVLIVGPLFSMMGGEAIKMAIDPVSCYLIFPGALFIGTLFTVWLVSHRTKRITASQTASIE